MQPKLSKYLFSVILPVYNAQKYLCSCLDSLLSQSFSNYEIIAVNDGSTDGSKKILDDYTKKDARIRVIDKLNQGPLLARVDAIRLADSEYCVFVDSDDCVSPDFFSTLFNELCSKRHDIYIYNYELISIDNTIIEKADTLFIDQSIFYGESKKELYKKVLEAKLNSLCIKAIKTKLLTIGTTYNVHNFHRNR
ncbi:glycosyltransferase [Sphaerochaeta associata]|uniref:Glycosyltransferase n=1 Tax=Sphaerochaeta associata TaxID=1129264 RepID=A0ABY4DEA4_9SPIR|nr:glycosyltransferase family 2 protein [Sphaerochaeta associata]UOM51444.1 glycosyltransferase [Sphaerochaeta associata]